MVNSLNKEAQTVNISVRKILLKLMTYWKVIGTAGLTLSIRDKIPLDPQIAASGRPNISHRIWCPMSRG